MVGGDLLIFRPELTRKISPREVVAALKLPQVQQCLQCLLSRILPWLETTEYMENINLSLSLR